MTRFEQLRHKAELCRLASSKAKSKKMKAIWNDKANQLEEMALNMPIVKAMETSR